MSTKRLQRASRALRRGYTAIEVLMAMVVFSVGSAGVVAMQRASIQGNADARRMDVANNIARAWVERLRRDSTLWTSPTPAVSTNNVASTQFIGTALGNGWVLPVGVAGTCPASSPTPEGLCPEFDIFGHDIDTGNQANAAYCVNVKLDTVLPDPVNTTAPDLIRAEVRVYWLRQLADAPPAGGFCSDAALSNTAGPNGVTATSIYHFVYATTLIRRNPAQ